MYNLLMTDLFALSWGTVVLPAKLYVLMVAH